MGDDAMTPGEVKRNFDRVDAASRATNDRLAVLATETVSMKFYEVAHQAVIDRVIHLEQDMLDRLARIEATAGERHKAVGREVRDLKELVEREVEDLRSEIKTLQMLRAQEAEKKHAEERSRRDRTSSNLIAWIAALAAVGLLIATVIQLGGR